MIQIRGGFLSDIPKSERKPSKLAVLQKAMDIRKRIFIEIFQTFCYNEKKFRAYVSDQVKDLSGDARKREMARIYKRRKEFDAFVIGYMRTRICNAVCDLCKEIELANSIYPMNFVEYEERRLHFARAKGCCLILNSELQFAGSVLPADREKFFKICNETRVIVKMIAEIRKSDKRRFFPKISSEMSRGKSSPRVSDIVGVLNAALMLIEAHNDIYEEKCTLEERVEAAKFFILGREEEPGHPKPKTDDSAKENRNEKLSSECVEHMNKSEGSVEKTGDVPGENPLVELEEGNHDISGEKVENVGDSQAKSGDNPGAAHNPGSNDNQDAASNSRNSAGYQEKQDVSQNTTSPESAVSDINSPNTTPNSPEKRNSSEKRYFGRLSRDLRF